MLHQKLIDLLRNLICCIGLIVISPIMLIAVLALIIEDGLPIFFLQERIGKHKVIFKIIKIRTLQNSAPHVGTHQLEERYKLVVGNLMRKIKLDEFPQLLNVIRGELNLVGPRPGLPNQDLLLRSRAEHEVFNVKPGITGLAQILGYDMSDPQRLSEIDKIYIQNHTVLLNIIILLGTFFNAPRGYLASKFNIPTLQKNL